VTYTEFLQSKKARAEYAGIEISDEQVNSMLYPFQRDIVRWACHKGRAAIFLDTGLGKTFIQLEWARLLGERTLIIAPLSVTRQTIREGAKIGIEIKYIRSMADVSGPFSICNYEMIDALDFSQFGAVVLDESSILKSIGGVTRKLLTERCATVKYRLCCTATPAPNDQSEIGNHAEFLGICKSAEMLAMFFIHANKQDEREEQDGSITRKKHSNKQGQEWRLKNHARGPFYEWMASWAVAMARPSELGYSDEGYILPKLTITPIVVESDYVPEGELFHSKLSGITDRTNVRRSTIPDRLGKVLDIINSKAYNNRHEQIGIHEGVQAISLGKVEEDSGATGEGKRTEKGIVRSGRMAQGGSEGASQEVAEGKSREKTKSENATLWDNSAGVPVYAGSTEGEMRHLQSGNGKALCGSLPQHKEDTGVALRELQLRTGIVQGQSEIANESDKISRWVIWCGLNSEQEAIEGIIKDYSSVYGELPIGEKEKRIEQFIDGETSILLSKPKICGWGLNLQSAHNMIFFGMNDSWESYYQCIRREWRYGQKHPVNVFIIMSAAEQEIWENVKRKERVAKLMTSELLRNIAIYERRELNMGDEVKQAESAFYEEVTGANFRAINGDSCQELPKLSENSIDLSVYSPPFADLYTYTNSEHDLGNSKDWGEFFQHYAFIIREVLRVTKPGRLTCVHSSDIPAMEVKDGYIGMRDFPGEVIRAYEREGWVFVGRAFIQKNPQAQAIRIKSKALLFAQLRKDSSHSRPAIIDQILIFKKPGENAVQIRPVENGDMENETWINWAHGIWFGIRESDVLRYAPARDADDEKHICPLQLGAIERCIKLYSNPGETVLTPFMGIGSEVYQAVRFGRKGIGVELKESYFRIAADNCRYAEGHFVGQDLFDTPARRVYATLAVRDVNST
jgi:DNA modification methylase